MDQYGTTDTIQGEEEELEQTKRLRQKTEERFQEQIAERRRRLELELRRTGRRRSRSRYRMDNKNLLGVNPHHSHRFFYNYNFILFIVTVDCCIFFLAVHTSIFCSSLLCLRILISCREGKNAF